MPKSPQRPCRIPGCPDLAEHGDVLCRKHKAERDKRYNKHNRDPQVQKMYGSDWKKLREVYISEHPLCEECFKNGKYTPTEEVHHILPLSKGGKNDINNLMALCQSCHVKIHKKIGDR